MKLEGEEKRFAFFQCCKDSDYAKKMYDGYFNVFKNAFADEGEKWDLFRAVDGEFPHMEDLHKYTGCIIGGSGCHAYDDDIWILRLCFILQTMAAMNKRILGLCFGHQIVCRAFGGKVATAHTGWDLGIRKVTFMVDDLQRYRFLKGLKEFPVNLSVIECHEDEVWEVPMEAEVIASSDKTAIEGFIIGDNILGIQGHPEYPKDILLEIIDRLANNNFVDREFANEAKAKCEGLEPDNEIWHRMCKNFLKGKEDEVDDAWFL